MADDLTIRVGGDATGAQQASGVASSALNDIGTVAQRVAATIFEAFQQAGGAVGSLVQANGTAVQSMQDMGAQANSTLGNSPGGLGSLFASLGQAVGQGGMAFDSFAGKVLGALNPLELLHSHIVQLVEVMGMWRLMEGGIQQITGMVDQVVSLPMTGQYQEMAWKYQYGGGAKGQQMAQQVMGWTFNESLNMPYQRQDMNSAISVLNTLGLSPAGIEKYLPVIADIAASAGTNMYGQPITLQQAAMSIMGAGMGYTRMLKYDLKINPDELRQFGYVDTGNMAELMSALTKYAQVHGRIGAAADLAHNTLQGGWTSVQDRLQNFAIAAGGMTMSGETDKHGLLQALMDTMNTFTGLTDARVYSGYTYGTAAQTQQANTLAQAVQDAVYKYGAGSAQAKRARGALTGFEATYGTDNAQEAQELKDAWLKAVREFGAASAQAKKAHTAYGNFEDAHSTVNLKSSVLGVAQIISHDLYYALSDGRDALLAFTKGLKATGLLDLIGTGFDSFSRWMQSLQTRQELSAVGGFLGGTAGNVAKNVLISLGSDWTQITGAWAAVAKQITPAERKQLLALAADIGTLIEDIAGALNSDFAKNLTEKFQTLGTLGKLLADLTSGNWGGALQDFGTYLQQMLNGLLQDIIEINPALNALNNVTNGGVQRFFENLGNSILKWLNYQWTAFSNWFPQFGNGTVTWLDNIWRIIQQWFLSHLPHIPGVPGSGGGSTAPSIGAAGGGTAGGSGAASMPAPYLSNIPGGNLLGGVYGAYGAYGAAGPTTNQFYISGMGYADTARLIDDVVNDRERWGGQVMHGPGGFRTWGQVGGAFGT